MAEPEQVELRSDNHAWLEWSFQDKRESPFLLFSFSALLAWGALQLRYMAGLRFHLLIQSSGSEQYQYP